MKKSTRELLKREIIEFQLCPICENRMTIDKKRFTIECKKCKNTWIWSKRIKRNSAGGMNLFSITEMEKMKNA